MKDTLKKKESELNKREAVAKEKEAEINAKKTTLKEREEQLLALERQIEEQERELVSKYGGCSITTEQPTPSMYNTTHSMSKGILDPIRTSYDKQYLMMPPSISSNPTSSTSNLG